MTNLQTLLRGPVYLTNLFVPITSIVPTWLKISQRSHLHYSHQMSEALVTWKICERARNMAVSKAYIQAQPRVSKRL